MEYYDSKSDPAPSEQDGIRKANVYSGTTPYALTSKNISAGETKYIKRCNSLAIWAVTAYSYVCLYIEFFKNLILTIEYQLKKTYNKMHK